MSDQVVPPQTNLQLEYTVLCDDVRLEAGNKLTIVGVFYGIFIPQLPITIIKFAVLNHWRGEGRYLSEVRILSPDRSQAITASRPTSFQIEPHGFADNVTLFANVSFTVEGSYWVQTLVDSQLYSERVLPVGIIRREQTREQPMHSRRIN